jgi:hypothetical protein
MQEMYTLFEWKNRFESDRLKTKETKQFQHGG